MAKNKEVKVSKNDEEEKVLTPQEQAAALLKEGMKEGKSDHYNFEPDNFYKIPCSSLIANSIMNGGLSSGAHRCIGNSAGGKTSCSLDFMFHFFKRGAGHRGIYVKSEGRLSPEVQSRSGIKFTNKVEEWDDNTCLILESNVFEFVFKFMGDLIRNNPTKCKYFFIIDSVDMMAKRDDIAKPMEDSAQVAGGALLTSTFMKKSAAALAKRGHICIFISQVRDTIKIDQRQKADTNKQGKSSGGHALEHAGDWVLNFGPRFQDDYIYEIPDDPKSKKVGHYCNITIIKSNNEKYGDPIRYPIKYGRIGGTSVWVEKEVADFALMWEFAGKAKTKDKEGKEKESNTYKFSDELMEEFTANNIEVPEKLGTGLKQYNKFLEDRPDIVNFLYQKFIKLLE